MFWRRDGKVIAKAMRSRCRWISLPLLDLLVGSADGDRGGGAVRTRARRSFCWLQDGTRVRHGGALDRVHWDRDQGPEQSVCEQYTSYICFTRRHATRSGCYLSACAWALAAWRAGARCNLHQVNWGVMCEASSRACCRPFCTFPFLCEYSVPLRRQSQTQPHLIVVTRVT
jgi:hypothetical protein